MTQNIVTLSNLPIGKSGIIKKFDCNNCKRKFFQNMGLICGTKISALQKSMCGTPIAYCFRGAVVALRKEDADKIIVEYC